MQRDEHGYIVVETIIAFMLFVFLNMSILSLIGIVAVQARIHYAMTQAAETISMYSYTLEAMGIADHMVASAKRGEKAGKQITDFATNINGVVSAIENTNWSGLSKSAESTYNQVSGFADEIVDNPKSVMQDFLNYGLNKVESLALDRLMEPLMRHYLSNGSMNGDEYLKAFHVVDGVSGLHFYTPNSVTIKNGRILTGTTDDSMVLDSQENIKLVVQYDIDYTFGILPLPWDSGKLHITQEVKTRAWLNGLGKGYVQKD